jgi:hypothetical protein
MKAHTDAILIILVFFMIGYVAVLLLGNFV